MANPKYAANGDLVCGACGKVLGRAPNKFGDAVASCSDPGCSENGRLYEEGGFRHNPHIPEGRKLLPGYDHPSRFYFGEANYKVKDGQVQN